METLPLEAYREVCELFDEGVYEAISLENACPTARRWAALRRKMYARRQSACGL